MAQRITPQLLYRETLAFQGSGGTSQDNAGQGFRPAFIDTATHCVYPSCFADGRPAPFHLIDGLPQEVVAARDGATGRVTELKASVVSGFVRGGRFYTREEAAACA